MSLRLSTDHVQTIWLHAERTYPNECCGLLLGTSQADDRRVEAVRAVQNAWNQHVATELHDDPTLTQVRRYWIDPADMLSGMKAARQQGFDIIGIYHSHIDHPAIPSECDRQLAWSQYSYLIVSVQQGVAIDQQSWTLNAHHHFQAETIQVGEPSRM